MPPKGSKRAVQGVAAEAKKKPKLDSMMVGVVDALGQATEIPEDCRAMLEAGVPGCLGPPANERHELQNSMVKWIGETIEGVEARLRQAVDDEAAKVAQAQAAKAEAEKAVGDAKGILEAKDADLVANKTAHKEAAQAVKSAKAGLTEAQAAQKKGDASLAEAGKVKEEFEGVLRDHTGYLKEDDGFDAKTAKTHTTQVMRFAKKLGLDDSLLTALPSACATMPSKRGSFDKMVISEMESSFQTKVTALAEEMNTGAEATASRAAAVTAAEQVVQAAEDVHKDAAAALAAAQTAQGEAASGLQEAEKGSKAKAADQEAAEALKENAEQVLQNFVGYNVLCFSTLRDKVSTPPEEPKPAVEPKPAEAPSPAPATSASPAPAVAEPASPAAAVAESTSPPAGISASPPAV